jgi:hypothetical protein
MASYWKASVELRDDNDKRTRMTLVIGTITGVDFAAEAADAAGILSDYVTDLKAISLANVSDIKLTCIDPNSEQDSGKPSTGSDVSEELVIVAYTDDQEKEDEVDRIRVPSPVATVWVNDNYEEGFDLADSDASNLVANFADGAMQFSDGEHVDTAKGTDGIKAGYWRSRKMQVKAPTG